MASDAFISVTHTHTRTSPHSHTLALTRASSHTYTHTYSPTLTHTHTPSHTHTLTLPLTRSLTQPPTHPDLHSLVLYRAGVAVSEPWCAHLPGVLRCTQRDGRPYLPHSVHHHRRPRHVTTAGKSRSTITHSSSGAKSSL